MLSGAFPRQLFSNYRQVGHKASGLHRGDRVVVFCRVRDAADHALVTLGRCDFGRMPDGLDACLLP